MYGHKYSKSMDQPGKVVPMAFIAESPPAQGQLTFVPLCDHERDWHLIGLWLTHCVTILSSVARTIR